MTYTNGDLVCPAGTYVVGTSIVVLGVPSLVDTTTTRAAVYFLSNDLALTLPVSATIFCAAGTDAAISALSTASDGMGVTRHRSHVVDRLRAAAEARGLRAVPSPVP